MKLDRNINPDGGGKYALVKMRRVRELTAAGHPEIQAAIDLLHSVGIIDHGNIPSTDCFVIRLKDKYAPGALIAYVAAAAADDGEYAEEVHEMYQRASNHPLKRKPD